MLHMIKTLIIGAVCGAITAFLGYAKSSTVETFDWKKAGQTIILGAVIGGISGYYGWTYEKAEEWAGNVGIVSLVEFIKKSIIRRLVKK